MKQKLYFRDIDDTNCYPLSDRLNDAKIEELTEITLIEADTDKDNPDYVWCGLAGECAERQHCKKSYCWEYESKSGRGVCKHRGDLYTHGKEVKFKVE